MDSNEKRRQAPLHHPTCLKVLRLREPGLGAVGQDLPPLLRRRVPHPQPPRRALDHLMPLGWSRREGRERGR